MDASTTGAIVEGIGNEVLITLMIGGVSVVLALAWYSTHLTNSQTRLTAPTIHRSGVRLNRLPGSSTTEMLRTTNNQQTTSREADSTTSSPSEDENQSAAAVASDTAAVSGASADSTSEGANVDSSTAGATEVTAQQPAQEQQPKAQPYSNTDSSDSQENSEDNSVKDTHKNESGDGAATCDVEESQTVTEDTPETLTGNFSASGAASEVTPGATPETTTAAPDDGSFLVRLKFLSDVERHVRAKSDDTVHTFKQANFAEDLSNNKLVRLIYNGQRLEDSRTLRSYNIAENTTIHALITDNNTTSANVQSQPDVVVFNAGIFMLPLFTLILAIIWYLRYEYAEFFNITSTASLACITAVFIFCLFAQNRPQEPMNSERGYRVTARETTPIN